MLPEQRLSRPVLPAWASAALYTLALFLFIALTRWPLAPRYLYYFDSANFALALEHFNPAMHQPQPPGYPLFVGLTRLIHIWIPSAEQVMVIAGLLAAFAATALIFLLASAMFGRAAGILSAGLLASNPAFWFAGVTNEIRLFLAVSSMGIALLAWRALTRPESAAMLCAAFAALGFAAGFRPVECTLFLPLLFWVWFRTGHSGRRLALAIACMAATSLPWVGAIVWAVGGVRNLMQVIWAYATDQFHGTSAVFGATSHSAYQMFMWALVWNILGSLSWLWALPFLKNRSIPKEDRLKALFLALGFFPAFLFSAFIHIGDPDQALASIPFLSIVGGAVLTALLARIGTRRVFTAAALVIVSHVILFFYPPGKIARASSYRAMADVDRMTTAALTSVNFLRHGQPLTILHFGSSVASRQLEYYFPDDYVVVLGGTPRRPDITRPAQVFYHHKEVPLPPNSQGILLPASRRVVCLGSFRTKPSQLPGWGAYGPVYYKDIGQALALKIGPFTLVRQ